MPKMIMTNRGPAGLLHSAPKPIESTTNGEAKPPDEATERAAFLAELLRRHPDATTSKIAPALAAMVLPIASLRPDPNNARVHPERNIRAIMASLAAFGQAKPIVVRREGMVVMAGNGTMDAVKRLGWTEIAASVIDMDEATAAGYGLADNRTAELATWDFKTVARLERLVSDAGGQAVGWTDEEVMALRMRASPPPPSEFPEVDENIQTDHVCPKCGYCFSGGETVERTTEHA